MADELKVKPGVYIPDAGIKYPSDPFERLVHVDVQNSNEGKYQFDENYKYLDDSFSYKFQAFLNAFLLWGFFAVSNRVRHGLRIEGKKILKKYRNEFANGAMTICNHIYSYDAVCVYQAVKPFGRMWIPMYAKHFNGKFGWLLHYMGGIPVAESTGGARKFYEAFDTLHERKQWFHIFPEEVRWDFYKPLRPFRKGAFTMAYKYGMPVIPCVLTYRPRKGFFKLTGPAKEPLLTLHIGEPIFPDRKAPRKEEIERIRLEAHKRMEDMAGILVNPWPAVPQDEV